MDDNNQSLRDAVRQSYAQAALRVVGQAGGNEAKAGCCGVSAAPACCASPGSDDPITSDLYRTDQAAAVPAKALAGSLGCGNPTALAELRPGETVLDLGSGGGIDVLLAARRVGPVGKAYGLDMTDEMLALAHANQQEAGVGNAEFLKGHIEDIPLQDAAVDVIISNCVINLAGDKDQVFREAFRVLRPGGRLAVADIVVRGAVPDAIRQSVQSWIGCIAGALEDSEYRAKLAAVGFTGIAVEPTRVYRAADAATFLASAGLDAATIAPQVDGKFVSAFIRATKPA